MCRFALSGATSRIAGSRRDKSLFAYGNRGNARSYVCFPICDWYIRPSWDGETKVDIPSFNSIKAIRLSKSCIFLGWSSALGASFVGFTGLRVWGRRWMVFSLLWASSASVFLLRKAFSLFTSIYILEYNWRNRWVEAAFFHARCWLSRSGNPVAGFAATVRPQTPPRRHRPLGVM